MYTIKREKTKMANWLYSIVTYMYLNNMNCNYISAI